MKLLDRYLLREMVIPFLIGHAAIVLMLTGTVLYNNANVFLLNEIPLLYVVRMVLYFAPFLVHMTMPVAMAVGASLAVSRLGRDSEITVIRSAGVSLRRLFLPIIAAGLFVSIGDFYFGEYVVPPAIARFNGVIAELPTQIRRLTPPPGQFIISSDQSYALFVKSMVPRQGYIELHGVQIVAGMKAIFAGETQPFVAAAETGRYADGRWIMERPTLFRYRLNGAEIEVAHPERLTYFLPVEPHAFQTSFLLQLPMGTLAQSATRTFTQLGVEIRRNREQGVHDLFAVLDYHFKLSVPFSCLVMALCCPPLALRFARGGGFMGTLLSICLVFIYWNTLLLARILGSPGPEGTPPLIPPPLAAWSQNILFALLGLYTLYKSE